MKSVSQAIQDRRSIRKYKTTPIEEKDLQALIEAFRLAPSGSNSQAWDLIVVTSCDTRQTIAETCHNQLWMAAAPVHIIVCASSAKRNAELSGVNLDEESKELDLKASIRDAAIATENILLEATSLGLGSCWVAYYQQKDIRPILGIPDDVYVMGVIPIGYADESPHARPRQEALTFLHKERW